MKEKEIILESATTKVTLKASDTDRGLEIHVDGQGQRATFFKNGVQVFGVNNLGTVDSGKGVLGKPYKSPIVKKVRIVGDSITVMGSFVSKLKAKLNAEVIADSFPGSHAGMGLSTVADEYWAYVTGENALKYSNDLLGSGWAANTGITRENNQVLGDCCTWNKVTRTVAGGDAIVFAQDTVISTGFTGIASRHELYIPPDSTFTKLDIWFVKYVSGSPESGTEKKVSLSNLVPGRKYKIVFFFDKTKLNAGWAAGDTLKMKVFPGSQLASGIGNNCVAYFRNWNVSYKSPNGIENYTPTLGTAAAGGTATLTKIDLNENQFDTTIVLFSRNDAQKNVVSSVNQWIAPRTFFKTMDKLVAQCKKFSNQVIPVNCPPKKHDTLDTWDAADPYKANGLNDAFNTLCSKHNSGVNVWEGFQASGKPPSLLMYTDGLHESDPWGGDEIVNMIADEVNDNRNISNHALPELQGAVKHYLGGVNTGSWVLKTEDINSTDWITNGTSYTSYLINPLGVLRDTAWVSSTSGDKITFSGINGKQVHVVIRVGDSLGTFFVKLNPGTPGETSYGINTNYIGMANQIRGYYVLDNLPPGDNVVEITVNTGEVHICGITVC